MRILLIASAFNSLTQRVHAELRGRGHQVAVQLALGDDQMRAAVDRTDPELILCPMLTKAVPEDIWRSRTVLIVHPGPKGDRGPSSLDWAITEGAERWGVTVLQAVEEMDAGDIWASVEFPVADCGKSELYRNEVADAAVEAVLLAVQRYEGGLFTPEPLDYDRPDVHGRLRPFLRQDVRRIDWAADDTATVLRKLRAADSQPGVLDELYGREYFLHGGHPEDELRGPVPGAVLATRDGAICRATVDGAVWIAQLRPRRTPGGPATFKQPAATVLADELHRVCEVPVTPSAAARRATWSEIRYHEDGEVGFLEFAFPSGAMSTDQCRRLLAAYREAADRPTSVLVLGAPRDFYSNGIHLNVIEGAPFPALESWENINAMDDVVAAILTTTDKLTVSALAGNAAAGGLMLAIAADEVWCRESAVLNPHYRLMGLYGSEYWTYTLPGRVGAEQAERLTTEALPLGADHARRIGLVDRTAGGDAAGFRRWVAREAARLAASPELTGRLVDKKRRRAADEEAKPLADYRAEELRRMHANFYRADEPYHTLRRNFVHKVCPVATPEHLTGLLGRPEQSRPE
ncbi:hydrogenase maturation protein [Kitasatospora aureofaciens]|uniref:hydrogenase maturation protein n=1 Tax=Kitasatospora aureofaciens TaxID=1894 RepID=UPI001C4375ED|nr:hydrogenase maturation protein [Kitasatospora aureofaciens]MBV6702793.1 hydrogenase maturation protein [Kitasatospora aureofaciens]